MTIGLGWPDFSGLTNEPWLRLVLPLHCGIPTFSLIPCPTMCLVVSIVFIEATGMFLALGSMTNPRVDAEDVTRVLQTAASGDPGIPALSGGEQP